MKRTPFETQILERIEHLEKDNKALNESLNTLVEYCSDMNKDINRLIGQTSEKSTEEKSCLEKDIVVKLLQIIESYCYSKSRYSLGPNITNEQLYEVTHKKMNDLISKTGFVSLCIDNGKAFLYALNPCFFLEDHDAWNYYQGIIEDEFHLTLCLGHFSLNAPDFEKNYHLFGVDIQSWIKDWIEKHA